MSRGLTRRRFLGTGAGLGAALALGSRRGRLIDRALSVAAEGPSAPCLSDIEHVVVLIQENRSFDHYFGSLWGVNGFGGFRPGPLWQQAGITLADGEPYLQPFHLDTGDTSYPGYCTNDIDHSWVPQHTYWDGGRNDRFVSGHVAVDGPKIGPVCMGYYRRADLPFYYALADAFTVCDGYHCSVLGPTDPNRLYTVSGMLDPHGRYGGPLIDTQTANRAAYFGRFRWTTMPEVLQAAGVSWKVYQTPDAELDDVLPYFAAYYRDPSLAARAFGPTFPGTFQADVAAGRLPAVSWVLAPVAASEHPAAPPPLGEYAVYQLLETLVSNPDVWARTALLVTYDENGGFFDHVVPPTAPAGTPGEYIDPAVLPGDGAGVTGPIGLGFRVPMLVVSPFSTGGLLCSDTFDHTSLLQFLERRFGVSLETDGEKNISPWRYRTCGDLTAAFDFAAPPRTALPPTLAATAPSPVDPGMLQECATNAALGTADRGADYPLPASNTTPVPEPAPAGATRRRPSGLAGPACRPRRP